MNKDDLIHWIRTNKDFLNVGAIGRAAGLPNLRNIVNRNKNGRGEELQLSDKKAGPLGEVVEKITSSAPPARAYGRR